MCGERFKNSQCWNSMQKKKSWSCLNKKDFFFLIDLHVFFSTEKIELVAFFFLHATQEQARGSGIHSSLKI